MFKRISSRQNPIIKEIKRIVQGRSLNKIPIETTNLLDIVMGSSRFVLELILVTERFINNNKSAVNRLRKKGIDIIIADDDVITSVSDTKTPQGIIGIVRFTPWSLQDIDLKVTPAVVVCDAISDPGNLGTIIRSCDAFGVGGVFVVNDACNIYSPKVIRASAGSIMNIPVVITDVEVIGHYFKKHNLKTYATVAHNGKIIFETRFDIRCAIILGNESHGISNNIKTLVDYYVTIPLSNKTESLNVASAGAVFLYEIMRQRKGV